MLYVVMALSFVASVVMVWGCVHDRAWFKRNGVRELVRGNVRTKLQKSGTYGRGNLCDVRIVKPILPPPPKEPSTIRDESAGLADLDLPVVIDGMPQPEADILARRMMVAREIVALAHRVDPIEVRMSILADDHFACLLPDRALHHDMQATARVCGLACGCTVDVCAPTHDTDADALADLRIDLEPTDGGDW
jgi:hypothetical protein